ncbi:hypothetical protein PVAP13_4KG253105 [Panicum virgatum]|uniref:Uncharacterized protein n=1 Tax=Panicum virgatum TaxID=38727 RepID=A0A8T0TT68_PANVG|nr:hypothetical protein PVAP13_4KG253105 [Panicum virgatum]
MKYQDMQTRTILHQQVLQVPSWEIMHTKHMKQRGNTLFR